MKTLRLQTLTLFLISMCFCAHALTITESGGWRETVWVKWQGVENAGSYNVYINGEGLTNVKIDDQLTRKYGDYFRTDVPGLKAGNYTLKIVALIENVEGENATSATLTATAHDRSGFAFSNGRVPGAYKADGTPKDGAVVLYITENTKNKVSLEVTGANANPCVGLQTILDGFKKGDDNRPVIIRMVGQITDLEYMLNGDLVIENKNNAVGYITLEGIGDDAVADGWGIRVKNASNIEIRNIGLMNCNSDEGDNIGLQQDNDYIWVHHCDFFYGDAGGDADQAKGDGALDSKRSGYVTFSYNHFWDTGKSNLLGNGVEDPKYLTYHHNWYDHSDSRHPRVRSHNVHVYNNYYDGNSKYGVGATNASSVFVEANYFRNCKYPMLISMQGSDVFDESQGVNDYSDMPTFSKEDGGVIKAYNNVMTGQQRFVSYGNAGFPNSTVDFDAYVAASRDEKMDTSIKTYQGGTKYNNFDTDAGIMYAYNADSPEEAKNNVMAYAGRLNGGDFTWNFNNAVDDADDEVNAGLKSALTSYVTSLVSVQGDSTATGGGGGGDGGGSAGDMIHNFTVSGTSSTFYTISGNLSTSKGTVILDSLTLAQCLKMESATSINFSIDKEATITMIFNDGFSGIIKINGNEKNIADGKLTLHLDAGNYEITKGDVANLYFISLSYTTTISVPSILTLSIKIYPNPVTDKLYIQNMHDLEKYEIYNITGVLQKKADFHENTIDMSGLKNGMYMVIVHAQNNVFKQLIIKK